MAFVTSIVVETGAIVAGANSYVTLAEVRAYATLRGFHLNENDQVLEPSLFAAIEYLEAKRSAYQGVKVSADQALQWPRSGAFIDGFEVGSSTIPNLLKDAQCRLACEHHLGTVLMPTYDKGFVIREKVDVLETEYSESVGTSSSGPVMNAVEALLGPLLVASGTLSGFSLRSVRV